jgi:predicted transcriptional regulator
MKKEPNRDKVIRILKEFEEGLTITALSEKAGLARNTVKVVLAELRGAEHVRVRTVGMAKLHYWNGK